MARAMWRKKLDPAGIDEYVRAHGEPWPELIAEIKASGIRNFSIFLDDNEAFGYYEHDDLDALAASEAAPSEVSVRWEASMRPLSADKESEGQGKKPMLQEVFHCD